MTLDFLPIESPDGKRVLRDFRDHGFVLLAGSAISEWEDSNLPTGEGLTSVVAEVLSESLSSASIVKQWIKDTAFEHIMENCPNREILGDSLLQLFSPTVPNPLHKAIARLVDEGVIEHIVTTNYDSNLESACHIKSSPRHHIQLIVTESEAKEAKPHCAAIFKVHGSADYDRQRNRGESRTMIYTLGREGELPPWKRNTLYRLAAGRRLLVCGYSGRDFEICPELSRLNATILWNIWKPEHLTPNARRVLTATGGSALIGDMRIVFSKLLSADLTQSGLLIEANRLTEYPSLKQKIFQGLTEWDLDLWRMRTLVGIGAATEGIRLAEAMRRLCGSDPSRNFDALLNLGRCQFHAGKYRRAVVTYSEARALAERENRRDLVIQAKSDLFEALRCHGNWFKARKELQSVQAIIRPDETWLEAAMALRSVLLLRYYYQLAKAIRITPWKTRTIRRRCKDLLSVVVRQAKDDHWLELQQAELWADRLDIRFSELYDGPLNPLPSKDGYKQLGYLIAESMAIRDHLVRNRGETEDDIARIVDSLNQAGALAELWKLVRVASRFKRGTLLSATQRRAGFRAWWACEYTLLMRLFVTFFH